jgi:hypothetical protein
MRGPDGNRVYSQGLSRHNRKTDEHRVDKIGCGALIRDIEHPNGDPEPHFAAFG